LLFAGPIGGIISLYQKKTDLNIRELFRGKSIILEEKVSA
jgi:hypothetical protein